MKTYFPKFDQSLNNFFIKYKIGNVQRTPEGNPGFIVETFLHIQLTIKLWYCKFISNFHSLGSVIDTHGLKENATLILADNNQNVQMHKND